MKSSKFGIPVINVGNLSMGGTGKTPHVEYLIRLLKDDYKTATLSRGFGRKERGFQIADQNSTAEQIGDEPLQYYKKYGDKVTVSVEADRVLGAMDLFRKQEEVEVLLLDDAYQHRKIFASLNILLTDYNAPFYKDFILPVGNLREARSGKNRADIIIVTKCPNLTDTEKKAIRNQISPAQEQQLFFSKIQYGGLLNFDGSILDFGDQPIILVTGIANASPLKKMLAEKVELIHHFEYNDHHKFRETELQEIHNLFTKFADRNPLIVTTEKDAMRLISPQFSELIKNYPWCYQSIEVEIDQKQQFDQIILQHVKKDN